MEGRITFHQALNELYLDVIRMANITIDTIEKTKVAFDNLDYDMAQEIIEGDDVVDGYIKRIESDSIELLARQAPVAIDLRRIIVIMRTAQHLERCADYCVNISKAIQDLSGDYTMPSRIATDMDEMFDVSAQMLVCAIEAFKERDEEKAARLHRMDDPVDQINRKFFKNVIVENDDELDLIIRSIMIARFIERIADHAVDMGDDIRYMITGEFIA